MKSNNKALLSATRMGVSILISLLAVLLTPTVPANAARVHTLLSSEPLPGEQVQIYDIAVNQTTHHFYVTPLGGFPPPGGFDRTVYNFDPDGKLDEAQPELPGAEALVPLNVAVDNSGGTHDGYLYASSVFTEAIQQYDPSGSETSVKITEVSLPSNGTLQGGGMAPVVNNGSFVPRSVAVGPTGDLFAYDQSTAKIDRFTATGSFVAQFGLGGATSVNGMALDASGDLYLAAQSQSFGSGLYKLNPAGECVPASCEPIAERGPSTTDRATGVAVDRATGNVFMTSSPEGEGRLSEYDLAGNLLGVTQPKELRSSSGIAVDEVSGKLIVGSIVFGGESTVQVYGPVKIVPDVETELATDITDHSATIKGKIGAAEVPGATCALQFVDEEEFQAHRFQGAAEAACQPEGPFSGSSMQPVEVRLSGLQGGTTYHFRLVGSNENGSNQTEEDEFTTKGPSVKEEEAFEVTEGGATLEAEVNPNCEATTYRFQYVSEANFEADGYVEASTVPTPPAEVPISATGSGDLEAGSNSILALNTASGAFKAGQRICGLGIPAGTTISSVASEQDELTLSQNATQAVTGAALTATGFKLVSQRVNGLTPGTAYRFRLLAESADGSTTGRGRTFSTFSPPPTGLPDSRAYEQASPIEKGGASLQGERNAVQASLDGSRITFFSNSGLPGVGDGEQTFPTYLATRVADGSGWSTQGLLPPASFGSRGEIIGWNEELSEVYDFASDPFGSTRLLERSSSDGSLSEVAVIGRPTSGSPLYFAGTSAGGGVALLESEAGEVLPGDRAGKQNVYAYDRETGSLVVAGVMNDGSVPPGGAMGGPYDWFNRNDPNSRGGARDQYFTQDQHAISADGKRIFFTAGGTGQLYVRENPLAEQSAVSDGQCTEAAKACTTRISAPEEGVADPDTPAAFVGASADGSLAYFLDKGKLTADSTAKGDYDLYRYNVESGDLTDLTVDTVDRNGAQVEGVLGIDKSGEDIYFAAAGGLAAGASKAPQDQTNLYAIHGEATELIAQLPSSSVEAILNWIPRSATDGEQTIAHTSRVSADGQTLLLRSATQLTSYPNHGVPELYLHRTGEGIVCISCNPTRQRPLGGAGLQEIPLPGFSPARPYAFMTRNLSADGKRVIFDSADQLLASDENGVNDVYEWEQKGKGSCQSEAHAGGCLFLISSGTSPKPSYFADADIEGNNVFFFTEQQLVPQDKDQLVDVYDARVNGGIAAQNQTPSPPCEGEACLGPASSGGAASPGTVSFSGPGNPARPRACAKGRTRRHGRCVKHGRARKKHSKKHHKQAKRRTARARGGLGK